MVIKHKQRCEQELTNIRTSNESHLYWNNHFHTNPIYFRNIAVFEADNQFDNSSTGNKTTNFFRQNPVLNGY